MISVTLLVSNLFSSENYSHNSLFVIVIVSLTTLCYNKFNPNYNGSLASINGASKDMKQKLEKGLLPRFFINLAVLIAVLLIENSWILKLLSMIAPLGLLSVGHWLLLFIFSLTYNLIALVLGIRKQNSIYFFIILVPDIV